MVLFTFENINEWSAVFEDILIKLIGDENLRHIISQQVQVYETSSAEIEMAIGYDGNLYDDFIEKFRDYYDRITVFHGCKPVDVESYRKHGIKPLDIDFFVEQTILALSDYNVSKQDVLNTFEVLSQKGKDYHERYCGILCLSLSKRCFYNLSSQYLIFGSELIQRLILELFKSKQPSDCLDILRGIGIPTILHCEVSLNKISHDSLKGVVLYCLEVFLSSKMESLDHIHLLDDKAIEIKDIVLPSEIIDIIHPDYRELNDQWR